MIHTCTVLFFYASGKKKKKIVVVRDGPRRYTRFDAAGDGDGDGKAVGRSVCRLQAPRL